MVCDAWRERKKTTPSPAPAPRYSPLFSFSFSQVEGELSSVMFGTFHHLGKNPSTDDDYN